MTCLDVRDLFSALVDQDLEPAQRREVDQHLTACAECRRELDRFEHALGALRGLAPARAPVGFVDHVLRAVRPDPWHRRLLGWIFLPLRVKVPLQAALILASIAAVYLSARLPELEQASRARAPLPEVSRAVPPAEPLSGTGPRDRGRSRPPDPAKPARQEPLANQTEVGAPRLKAEGKGAPAPLEAAREESLRDAERQRPASVPLSPAPARSDEVGQRDERRSTELDATGKTVAPSAGSGVLVVKDRRVAEGAIGELVARVGGEEVSRRPQQGHTVLEILVPGSRYAELAEGLSKIGVWTVEREPGRTPRRILVTIRIRE